MNRARRSPAPAPATVGARVVALSALGAVALLFYYLTNLPLAVDVAGLNWKAGVGDDLVVGPLGSGRLPLIALQGADNEGVDLHFDTAQLDPDTVQELRRDFNLVVSGAPAAIAWTTKRKGDGHTMIDIVLQPTQGVPEVHIGHVGEGTSAGLSIVAHRATLTVGFSVLLGEDVPGSKPEQKSLQIAGAPPIVLPGALPISIVVPEDKSFRLMFPTAAPASLLHLGAAEGPGTDVRGLPVRDLGIRRSGSAQYRLYACAATEASHFWLLRVPRPEDCLSTPELRATELRIDRDSTTAFLTGSAFVVKDGTTVTDDWFTKLNSNKPLAALFALAFTGLAGWVWRVFARGGADTKGRG